MVRIPVVLAAALLMLTSLLGPAAAEPVASAQGAPGAGDPYFPLEGNGGYDVSSYRLAVQYDPDSDRLGGLATISAQATQNLSGFNLDLDGLTVRAILVNGRLARFARAGGELEVTPAYDLRAGRSFTTIVRYDGVPATLADGSGFIHTDDGALVLAAPGGASTWFPVNDHPSDKASYSFQITVPDGLEAIANGIPGSRTTHGGWTTWNWVAAEPMASYLATVRIGQFDVNAYVADGTQFVDAIDPDLYAPVASPRTGSQFAISQVGDSSYKRLTRTVSGGQRLEFWVDRHAEQNWDHMFVEARTPGGEDWTTLPDLFGHTSQSTGYSCPGWHALHPFLTHYQGPDCAPAGTTGAWNAVSGASEGWEHWAVDLSAYPGQVEVSISYVSDDIVQGPGLFVDDITVPSGAGTTSFELDGDVLDGWEPTGPPQGSPALPNNWIAGGAADVPPPAGEVAAATFARQPEIVNFLAGVFGPYPFSASGGVVDDAPPRPSFGLPYFGSAMENQTRPTYSAVSFGYQRTGDSVVVHQLAHQWFGGSLTVDTWQHIWLNEGFAAYGEWLWAEQEGFRPAQVMLQGVYGIPAEDPFWDLTIGDPGPASLFDVRVYYRGAATLQALRQVIGDEDFLALLPAWTAQQAGKTVTTGQFIELAEQISGQQLDQFFEDWLFTAGKPPPPPGVGSAQSVTQTAQRIIVGGR